MFIEEYAIRKATIKTFKSGNRLFDFAIYSKEKKKLFGLFFGSMYVVAAVVGNVAGNIANK